MYETTGPYYYYNATTDTSQKVDIDRLNKLYADSDGVLDILTDLCDKQGEKVNPYRDYHIMQLHASNSIL